LKHRLPIGILLTIVTTTALLGGIDILSSRPGTGPSELAEASQSIPRYAGPSLDPGWGTGPPPPDQGVAIVAGRSLTNDPCRHSWGKPRCGAVYWDPPVNNRPATLSVEIDPPTPREGQPVTFTFAWSDEDADVPSFSFCDGYSACGQVSATGSCPTEPTGPWSPPAVRRGQGRFVQTVVYPESGVFHWSAGLETTSSSYQEFRAANPCFTLPDPYASQTALLRPIIVVPPSWPREPLENDLAFIKTESVGTGFVEVHTLNAASGYQNQTSYGSPFPFAFGRDGTFQLVDMDGRRRPDLVFIQTRRTALGTVDVGWVPLEEHLVWETNGSDLPGNRHGDGWFEMTDTNDDGTAELVFIQTRNTATGRIEIHSRRRRGPAPPAPGSRRFDSGSSVTTKFGVGDHAKGSFEMTDMDGDKRPDLVFIKTASTGSGEVEVHWLSAASNYQEQSSTAAAIGTFERDNGTFEMSDMDGDERPDLVFIKTRATGSQRVEIHWLSGATGYRTKVPVVTKFGLWEHGNGRFSMVDIDGL
jgi:hypothetical protein